MKKLLRIVLTLVVLIGIAAVFYLYGKKPVRDGHVSLNGLTGQVEVYYDTYGIPHIFAADDSDAYRALGYVQAQDRLFQMELLRRLSQGKLAEIFGKKLLPVDKLFRTLGLARHAKQWIDATKKKADPKMLPLFESYLDGVNQFVDSGPRPIEFDLMGIPNHKYTMEDMASIMGYMAFSFGQALQDDPLTHKLSQTLDSSYMKDLGVTYTEGFEQLPVDALMMDEIILQAAEIIQQLQPAGLFHGSNSWLLSGKRTVSGQAILVNDPHIAFSQPAAWFEAQVRTDNIDIYGHFLPLIPFPMLGFNEKLAWGLTMFENDDMDLYLEKQNPDNPDEYWAIDHWQKYEQFEEVIKVNGEDDVAITLRKTRHGPVVNAIFTDLSEGKDAISQIEQPLSLWWTFLDVDNQLMDAFYELPFADTLDKAAAAASKIHAPGLNLMYANAHGDIAWWATARLPIRPQHVNSKFILDGASGADDVQDFYDFTHNPKQVNPESGMIYTANNQPADMGDGLVPGYYAPTDRPQRIVELLSAKEKYSVDDMKSILMDNTTPTAIFLQQQALPVLQGHRSDFSELEQKALHVYSQWKGNHDPGEIGATLYTRFRLELFRRAMEDEIGVDLYADFQHGFLMDRSVWRLLHNKQSPWWDDVQTSDVETRDSLIVQSWQATVSMLKERLGSDINAWQWQDEVHMEHAHFLGAVKPLDKIFNVGPYPSRAGIEAINNLMFTMEDDELTVFMGPSTRRIIDFSDVRHSLGINPTGQSGVVVDTHYDDQAEAYSLGMFRPQYIHKQDVMDHSEGLLILQKKQ